MTGKLVPATFVALIGLMWVSGLIEEIPMPPELQSCLKDFHNKTSISDTVGEKIFSYCLNNFLWKTETINWGEFNVTQADLEYFHRLVDQLITRHAPARGKRQATGSVLFPPSGFRIRREYRRLNVFERNTFHRAVIELKRRGEYDLFASMHQGIVIQSAHNGPNFLGWHRVYITMYEEALRRIIPMVVLPYWDSTLDFHMDEPTESVIWTPLFMGDGSGVVSTGPFASWPTPIGPLRRNIGVQSRLFSRQNIIDILTRCRHAEITFPAALPQYNLEFHHGGPHGWVGGHMAGLSTAAFDPIFFLHHAFVDYIWQLFRNHQRLVCGVNPATDYPPATGLHVQQRSMDAFPRFANIDGYANFWEMFWFNYEPSPTCTMSLQCGSPWLVCQGGICISRAAEVSGIPVARGFAGEVEARRGREETASMPDVGPRFIMPPSESRTHEFRSRTRGSLTDVEGSELRARIGRVKRAADVAPSLDNMTIAERSDDISLATKSYKSRTGLLTPIQNSFFINGEADMKLWVFVPIQVIYMKPSDETFPVHPVYNGQPDLNQEFYSIKYPELDNQIRDGHPKEFTNCKRDPSGAGQILLQSNGMNYVSRYIEYAIVDSRLPIGSSMVYMGVKNPVNETAEAIISAHDRCGRMCQPRCLIHGSNPPRYRPCSGAIRISSASPKMYGNTFGEAIMDVWHWSGRDPRNDIDNIQLVMLCNNDEKWPWN
ncbi:hypothetical protein ACJMK2_010901 [Sinanodonta woodiana]|uniref:Tyrosinase copper-binding domain-containing protein n=1 Tax=Sinanodonta woodiana TaxID=1069815 RepID=A0ABD3VGV3_SINWO